VINGVVAAPLIAAMVVLGTLPSVMGSLVLPLWLRVLGWLSAILMACSTPACCWSEPAGRRRARPARGRSHHAYDRLTQAGSGSVIRGAGAGVESLSSELR
jgi:hypothetical protein